MEDLSIRMQEPEEPEERQEPAAPEKNAPAVRSGQGSPDNIVFLGYLDGPEELLSSRRRCLFGMDSDDDAACLPTDAGLSLPGGGSGAKPAPWSLAVARGGDTYVLGVDGNWSAL